MITVPLRPDLTDYELTIALEDVTYTLRLRWSAREECHYLDVMDESGDPLHMGVKVVLSWPLSGRSVDLFTGLLFVFDTSGQDIGPGVADLGDRCQMVYLSALERALLEAD